MTALRVLHVITGLGGGGAEGALVRLISGSGSPEAHVVVSLMDKGVHGEQLEAMGTRVVTLGQKPGRIGLRALRQLRQVVRAVRPDIIQAWMYHANLVATIATVGTRTPVVWGIRRTSLAWNELGPTTWCVAKAGALISGFAPAAIISCGLQATDKHRRFGYANKICTIPNGFDASASSQKPETSYDDVIERFGLPPTAMIVGHAARLHPIKDHPNFLEAMDLVCRDTDCIALMAGKGVSATEPAFQCLTQPMTSARVAAVGQLSDLATFYQACDVFVLSSRSEGFPNVVAEAMLNGVPCVVTDAGDAAEVVGDTGWVVPTENPGALAAAIREALTQARDKTAWSERGNRCRERIRTTYSVEAMVANYYRSWEKVLEKQKCAG